MNFDEVRKNPVYFEDRFVVDSDMNHLTNYRRDGMQLPPEDYDQQLPSTNLHPPRRGLIVDGTPRRNTPGNVTMDASTMTFYTNLDRTVHLSHSNLKAKINAEVDDMKRQTEGQLMAVQTDDQQSFCTEPILARLNYDSVTFTTADVKGAGPRCKDPLEYGQVCLTEKRLFFVSRRRADYTVHIQPQSSKKIKDEAPANATNKQQEWIQTFPKQVKPKAYRLQMEHNAGSSYYEMIPVWNVKSVAMNTSGKSMVSSVIYSKSSCWGRWCGRCSCLRDFLELLLCEKCLFAPGKTWHSSWIGGEKNLSFENHDGNFDNLGTSLVQINRKVLIHATLPAWEQQAIVEIVVDAPTSTDKIADFIRILQRHSQQLNAPAPLGGNQGFTTITFSDNKGVGCSGPLGSAQGRR